MRNLEQQRYTEKGIGETLIGMISRCEILNNSVIIKAEARKGGIFMQMDKVMKSAATLAAAVFLVAGAVSVEAAAETEEPAAAEKIQEIGLPNPIVSYDTIAEMEIVLGFTPLMLPSSSGYVCTNMSVIDGVTADMEYIAKGRLQDEGSSLTVRSAELAKVADLKGDISGVYSAKWEKKKAGQSVVYIAKLADDSFAAHWVNEQYAFSFVGHKISRDKFLLLLRNILVPQTERDFVE